VAKLTPEDQQLLYITWLKSQLGFFRPFPKIRNIDINHLRGMSCLDTLQLSSRSWEQMLKPDNLPQFTWPDGFLDNDECIQELRQIKPLQRSVLSTVGVVIGTHVHDLKTNKRPTVFLWEEEHK
jgi:hypothetical protein